MRFLFLSAIYLYLAYLNTKKLRIHWSITFSFLWGITLLVPYAWFWALLFGIIGFFYSFRRRPLEQILAAATLSISLIRTVCFVLTFLLLSQNPALLAWEGRSGLRLRRTHLVLYYLGYGHNCIFEAQIRSYVWRAKSDLHLLSEGKVPSKFDIFAPQQTYKSISSPDGTIIYYSVGPDQEDDKGQIFYDPTNGIASKGDIILELKQKR